MEIDLKKAGYVLLGIALLVAVNTFIIKPTYNVISGSQTTVESVGSQKVTP